MAKQPARRSGSSSHSGERDNLNESGEKKALASPPPRHTYHTRIITVFTIISLFSLITGIMLMVSALSQKQDLRNFAAEPAEPGNQSSESGEAQVIEVTTLQPGTNDPVSNTDIRLLNNEGKEVGSCDTDEEGFCSLETDPDANEERYEITAIAENEDGDDIGGVIRLYVPNTDLKVIPVATYLDPLTFGPPQTETSFPVYVAVMDNATGEPLENAAVTVNNGAVGGYSTDEKGETPPIDLDAQGTGYELYASKTGYTSAELTLSVTVRGAVVYFFLEPQEDSSLTDDEEADDTTENEDGTTEDDADNETNDNSEDNDTADDGSGTGGPDDSGGGGSGNGDNSNADTSESNNTNTGDLDEGFCIGSCVTPEAPGTTGDGTTTRRPGPETPGFAEALRQRITEMQGNFSTFFSTFRENMAGLGDRIRQNISNAFNGGGPDVNNVNNNDDPFSPRTPATPRPPRRPSISVPGENQENDRPTNSNREFYDSIREDVESRVPGR